MIASFQRCLDDHGIRHFTASEVLYRGAADATLRLNTDPPPALWPHIIPTLRILDTLRDRIASPIRLTSIYRSPAYNRAVGGVPSSQHTLFRAADFSTANLPRAWQELLAMRQQGLFRGGLGLYRSFIHLDTRGTNATWRGSD